MPELNQEQLSKFAKSFESRLQSLLEEEGMRNFEIESLILKEKSDAKIMGLIPSCHLDCQLQGIPPKVRCEVVCG